LTDVSNPAAEQPKIHEIGKRTYVVADVEPLDVDGTRTVAVGTALWLLGFLMLLPFYSRLKADDHLWWMWTCLAGFGLGLFGWDYCRRRRKARLARLERRTTSRPGKRAAQQG
jgi:hypothetical protein